MARARKKTQQRSRGARARKRKATGARRRIHRPTAVPREPEAARGDIGLAESEEGMGKQGLGEQEGLAAGRGPEISRPGPQPRERSPEADEPEGAGEGERQV